MKPRLMIYKCERCGEVRPCAILIGDNDDWTLDERRPRDLACPMNFGNPKWEEVQMNVPVSLTDILNIITAMKL